jgi:hypothetical protein
MAWPASPASARSRLATAAPATLVLAPAGGSCQGAPVFTAQLAATLLQPAPAPRRHLPADEGCRETVGAARTR